MKTPHKHAEIIKAWADGASIEILANGWVEVEGPSWHPTREYRIKPEPKPDVELAYIVEKYNDFNSPNVNWHGVFKSCNLKLTFDGNTNKLIKAEVI